MLHIRKEMTCGAGSPSARLIVPEKRPQKASHQEWRGHKGIDDANRIALVHPIVETLGQQSGLPAIRSRNETLHRSPPKSSRES